MAWEAIHASEAARDHQPAVKTFLRRLHAEYAAGRVTKGEMDNAKTALLQPDVDIASVLTAWKVRFNILDDCDGGGDDDGGGGGDGDAGADASAAAAPVTRRSTPFASSPRSTAQRWQAAHASRDATVVLQ